MKNILKLVLSLLCLCSFFFGTALANEWTVSRVIGQAKYTLNGKVWGNIEPGLRLPNAAWVNTGPRSKVRLTRSKDTIFVGSYSLVAIYKKSSKRTQIRQDFGTITVDVKKRNYDHMGVETPFMAAIVKGTKFTVNASKSSSSLSVSRGRVEVHDRRSGEKASVQSGQRVDVNTSPESKLKVYSMTGRSERTDSDRDLHGSAEDGSSSGSAGAGDGSESPKPEDNGGSGGHGGHDDDDDDDDDHDDDDDDDDDDDH